jgi:DNA helicase IV
VHQVSREEFVVTLAQVTRREVDAVAPGRIAVIVSGERVEEIVSILRSKGLDAIYPRDQESKGLGADLIVLSAEGANGLEFDGVVVVEPSQIASRGARGMASSTARGLRTLYVAMTRPTRRLAIVAVEPLPETLR